MKRTKIVATIGPASSNQKTLEAMMRAGMNVARLNFSHGSYDDHRALIRTIRAAAQRTGKQIAIMQDLQGPRIRIGTVPRDGLEVVRGEEVVLVPERMINYRLLATGKTKIIPNQYNDLHKDVRSGSMVLISDGLIQIRVTHIKDGVVHGTVQKPGIIFTHKGINLPGVAVRSEIITAKDKQDLQFGLTQDIDYVALSFVKGPENIRQLRKLIPEKTHVQIIAKIERREAVKNFHAIAAECEGIMVARGDLGIEVPPEDVPLMQKTMIQHCLKIGKPVIVATQMLESMIINPRPTRAEVSDVANAVIDHTDAVMLSGETASGKYPVEAVQMMTKVIEKTEKSPFDDMPIDYFVHDQDAVSDAVAKAAYLLAKETGARAIVAASFSGRTARMIARYRPETSITVLTNHPKTERQLALVWGVYSDAIPRARTLDALMSSAVKLVLKRGIAKKGEKIVIVTGHPVASHENMNSLKVHTL
jgi:pyruvate kinase